MQFERNDMERKNLSEIKELESKISHIEIKYKADTSHFKDQIDYEKKRSTEYQT